MKNQIYEDYSKVLIKTFFKYSWFKDDQNKANKNKFLKYNNNMLLNNLANSNNSLRIFPFEIKE